MRNRKAVTVITEQIFIVLFGVLVFVGIVALMGSFRRGATSSVGSPSLGEVASVVHSSVISAYSAREFSASGKIPLELPQKIAGHPYLIYLYPKNVTVVASDQESLRATASIYNIETNLGGNISPGGGGNSYVSYNSTSIYLETIRE